MCLINYNFPESQWMEKYNAQKTEHEVKIKQQYISKKEYSLGN